MVEGRWRIVMLPVETVPSLAFRAYDVSGWQTQLLIL